MNLRSLRWLSLLALLGLIAIPLKQFLYFVSASVFIPFFVLFWYDERTEANFRRAAVVACVTAMICFAGVFIYLGMVVGPGYRNVEMMAKNDIVGFAMIHLSFAWILAFILFQGSFLLSYVYFERKGI